MSEVTRFKVKWLAAALSDIERLYTFLYDKNPQAAGRAAACILEGAYALETSLYIGRPMADETKRRELFIPFGTGFYVLRYRIEGTHTVVVLRVWHSREERIDA